MAFGSLNFLIIFKVFAYTRKWGGINFVKQKHLLINAFEYEHWSSEHTCFQQGSLREIKKLYLFCIANEINKGQEFITLISCCLRLPNFAQHVGNHRKASSYVLRWRFSYISSNKNWLAESVRTEIHGQHLVPITVWTQCKRRLGVNEILELGIQAATAISKHNA